MLICPVRGCQLDLACEQRRLVCARGHSFDIARTGYINLLQPQDRRSNRAGDSAEAIAARRRLHDRGLSVAMLEAISAIASPLPHDVVLDAGCGDGFYLGTLAASTGFDAHGVDISVPAIQAAARRFPDCEWIVANADRMLPYRAESFSLVVSITARMNAGEFRRVLGPDGRLLLAVPAPDDLIELRGAGHDRVARTVEAFAPYFRVAAQRRATTAVELDAEGVHDVLLSIYRPMRREPAGAMRVTFSLDLLMFRPT